MSGRESGVRFSEAVISVREWIEDTSWGATFGEWIADFFEETQNVLQTDLVTIFGELDPYTQTQLIGACFEAFLAAKYDDGSNVVDAYLDEMGDEVGGLETEYLTALKQSQVSLYEVVESVPRSHVVVRDLIRRSEPFRISEVMGSQSLVQWDTIGARVVVIGGEPLFSGIIMKLERSARDVIMQGLESSTKQGLKEHPKYLRKQPAIVRAVQDRVLQFLPEFVAFNWLVSRIERSRTPELRNTSGEELEFITLNYPVVGIEAADRLLKSGEFFPTNEEETSWMWNPHRDPEGTIYATLVFSDTALMVSVNSLEREKAVGERLLELAGDLIGNPTRESTSLPEMLAKPHEPNEEPELSLAAQEEMSARIGEALDRHYHKVLDENVPFLDGATPRKAATTPEGRKKLVDWLKQLEASSADVRVQKELREYDYSWMWTELGVSHLR